MTKVVLLTGVTGFAGSHLAEHLLKNNYKVIALIREKADTWRCKTFLSDNLVFIRIDAHDLLQQIQPYSPSSFIHAAWQGVTAAERNNWEIQAENVLFTTRLLALARDLGIKKIISFGSQAEYGFFSGRISEQAETKPVSAYGAAKVATLDIMRSFCEAHNISWFWLRLFSLFGTREGKDWLIPTVIHNALSNKKMELTNCEQRYDYLYIRDFCVAVEQVILQDHDSGVFNLGSDHSIQLRRMIEEIKMSINPDVEFRFGALPLRPNQVMHMEGDSTRFYKTYGFAPATSFENGIKEVIEYYTQAYKN